MNTSILVPWSPACLSGIIVCPSALVDSTSILAAGDEVVGGKSLVSHGPNTVGQNECWGTYDDTTNTGWGPAYQNSCIHSGSNDYSGGNTVWYNYTLASAGTIINENTTSSNPATNMNTATESVCPSGWTLPTAKQIDNNRDTSSFSPVLGGYYNNGALSYEDTRGFWWGSTAYGDATRYNLAYDGSSLSTGGSYRRNGRYVRCVSEEKAITSLTYMQDMTPAIVASPPMLIAIL